MHLGQTLAAILNFALSRTGIPGDYYYVFRTVFRVVPEKNHLATHLFHKLMLLD